jgi:hypothetical protein
MSLYLLKGLHNIVNNIHTHPGIMSSFPTDWRVFPSSGFEDFSHLPQLIREDGRTLILMLRLDASHSYAGDFRIRFVGGAAASFQIALVHIIPSTPEHLHGIYLDFTGDNDDVSPPRNSTSTAWMDVEELIRSRVVTLSLADKSPVDPAELLAYLQSTSTEKEPSGAAVRWAVDVDSNRQFTLQLQTLPSPAKLLQKSHLQGENAVSVLLGSVPVRVELFDDPTIDGPVPIFFSDDPTGSSSFLTDHPVAVREDISGVNARFLRHEVMSMLDAQHYLKKNRRAAKGTSAFPPVRSSAAKRRRTTPNTETGTS